MIKIIGGGNCAENWTNKDHQFFIVKFYKKGDYMKRLTEKFDGINYLIYSLS